eukprot:1549379-Prymnesium_polylepis.1
MADDEGPMMKHTVGCRFHAIGARNIGRRRTAVLCLALADRLDDLLRPRPGTVHTRFLETSY